MPSCLHVQESLTPHSMVLAPLPAAMTVQLPPAHSSKSEPLPAFFPVQPPLGHLRVQAPGPWHSKEQFAPSQVRTHAGWP